MTRANPSDVPPTFNDLGSSERSRLMRSTRKLGDVLGTTPHLTENRLMPSFSFTGSNAARGSKAKPRRVKKHRRTHLPTFPISSASPYSSSYNSPSTSSSESSHEATRPRSHLTAADFTTTTPTTTLRLGTSLSSQHSYPRLRKATTRPTILHLQSVVVPRAVSMIESPTFMMSPIEFSPGTTTPADKRSYFHPVNVSNTQTFDDRVAAATARRRKMSRIVRTLGENVPADLVFTSQCRRASESATSTYTTSTSFEPLRRDVINDAPADASGSGSGNGRKSSLKRIKSAASTSLHQCSIVAGLGLNNRGGHISNKPNADGSKSAVPKSDGKTNATLAVYTFPPVNTDTVTSSSLGFSVNHNHGVVPARTSGIDHFDSYTQVKSQAQSVLPTTPQPRTSPLTRRCRSKSRVRRMSSMIFGSSAAVEDTNPQRTSVANNTAVNSNGHYVPAAITTAINGTGAHYRKSVHVPVQSSAQSRWEGTWNRNDMAEVRQGLRALKV